MEEKICGYIVWCKESNVIVPVIPSAHDNRPSVYKFINNNRILFVLKKLPYEDLVDFAINLETLAENLRRALSKIRHRL